MAPNSPEQSPDSPSAGCGTAGTDAAPETLNALRQAMTEIDYRHAQAQDGSRTPAVSAPPAASTAQSARTGHTTAKDKPRRSTSTTIKRTRTRRYSETDRVGHDSTATAPDESGEAIAWSSPDAEHPDWIADLVAESAASGDLGEDPDTDEQIEDFDTSYARGKKSAMNMLAMRDHSRSELREKLLRKDVLPEAVDELLDKLEKSHLLDDAEYAHRYVRAHRERRRLSRTALRRELTKKGVTAEIISDAVDEVDGEEDLARAVAQKKANSTRGLDRTVRERRILGMLARRGFPSGICIAITREVLVGD